MDKKNGNFDIYDKYSKYVQFLISSGGSWKLGPLRIIHIWTVHIKMNTFCVIFGDTLIKFTSKKLMNLNKSDLIILRLWMRIVYTLNFLLNMQITNFIKQDKS